MADHHHLAIPRALKRVDDGQGPVPVLFDDDDGQGFAHEKQKPAEMLQVQDGRPAYLPAEGATAQ
ncbi:hypothetical protein GCM10017056_12570 [Seohaeicola zhoushanensis]|uniref:Uncharacterized protein n=1 Tax=Seohaeicola zhoushanensis TaxID=1569283 RepID=A0A8J3GV40_9RHOB|nr:hypothetical protein GCM10017056_12570 [Seohaeicola zhoushanensis]